jgi:methyl-accepting chemotaxis protein
LLLATWSEAKQQIGGPLTQRADGMMKAMAALIAYNGKGAEDASQRSSDVADEAFTAIIVSLLVIMLALAAIATVLTRSIVVPLADAWLSPSVWPPATSPGKSA